ncbi:MAG: glycosyltransferase family 2 protein [Chitinophagaceae bacterium]
MISKNASKNVSLNMLNMLEKIEKQLIKLGWMAGKPAGNNKIALVVPQYNEYSKPNFEDRLHYFRHVSTEYHGRMDVIIIDDGSTDGSLRKLKSFLGEYPGAFFLAAVRPNADKVGAIFITIRSIKHEFIVLSDFDTDIKGMDTCISSIGELRNESNLMGCYFRMLPFEGRGLVFRFQQAEYSLLRSLYKFYKKDGSVGVMPGAGACYKRTHLLAIYEQHSGLRNGEDREATLIGLKLGYKTIYQEQVLTLTRPPLTFQTLINQRVRWNLGYLETVYKEQSAYFYELSKMSRLGIIFIMDILTVSFILLLPFLSLFIFIILGIKALFYFLGAIYLLRMFWCVRQLLIAPLEFKEIRRIVLPSVLMYPVQKMLVAYFSWTWALLRFVRNIKAGRYCFEEFSGNSSLKEQAEKKNKGNLAFVRKIS